MPSKQPPKRERDIRLRVVRDPAGAILKRDSAPVGLRTPNGFVWGHQVDHLVWMPRVPGTNALTVWSRSMLKALGDEEGFDDQDPAWGGEPLVPPRVLRPWPVLRLAGNEGEGEREGEGKMPHAFDEGCEHEHYAMKAARERERERSSEDEEKNILQEAERGDEEHVLTTYADLNMMALIGECPDDPEEICTGPILFNKQQAKNARGEPYAHVWCEHFRDQILGLPDPQNVVVFAVAATGNPNLDADTTGIWVRRTVRGSVGEGSAGTSSKGKGKARDEHGSGERDREPSGKEATDDCADVVMSEMTDTVSAGDDVQPTGEESGNKASEATSAPPRDPYSVEGLPKLEEFIPDEFFPDVLMVHDPDNTTKSRKNDDFEADSEKDKPIMYKRYYPNPDRKMGSAKGNASTAPKEKENVAHLYMRKANRFGVGNHSHVYRAPLTLPPPLTARAPSGQVTVAAKLAYGRCSAHHLLHNEARVYDTLAKDMQEDWCGYNVVPQCRYPVPVGAIAPKFFGYYLPVNDEGKPMRKRHPSCTEEWPCNVQWASPILLMEECGSPVEPSKFTLDQRTECFSLVQRLHHADIVQGSFYVRNIMCQPGPLTLPPEQRSYDTASFRIIDFGRGKSWDWELDPDSGEEKEEEEEEEEEEPEKRDELRRAFRRRVLDEVARARRELLVPDFAF